MDAGSSADTISTEGSSAVHGFAVHVVLENTRHQEDTPNAGASADSIFAWTDWRINTRELVVMKIFPIRKGEDGFLSHCPGRFGGSPSCHYFERCVYYAVLLVRSQMQRHTSGTWQHEDSILVTNANSAHWQRPRWLMCIGRLPPPPLVGWCPEEVGSRCMRGGFVHLFYGRCVN